MEAVTTLDVLVTTVTTTRSTTTVTVPAATSTVFVDRTYTQVYGPVNGCAYISGTDQFSLVSTTQAGRDAECAKHCDQTPGCKSVNLHILESPIHMPACTSRRRFKTKLIAMLYIGVFFFTNDFPPCGPNGDYGYCVV